MNIVELRKQIMVAKKEKNLNRAKVLSAILDQAQKIAKADKNREVEDKDIVAGAKAEVKMATQSKEAKAPYLEETFDIALEFLPKQMSEREILVTIEAIIADMDKPNLGLVMKELKNFGDTLDMKVANKIIKENNLI